MTSECTRWSGYHRKSDGRPIMRVTGKNPQYAYRVLWEDMHGPLARGLVLHHTCENAWCINLDHLVPVTRARHKAEHGLVGDWGQARKTHCPAGHEYAAENTYVYTRKDGRVERHCRSCTIEAKRRYRARRVAATETEKS